MHLPSSKLLPNKQPDVHSRTLPQSETVVRQRHTPTQPASFNTPPQTHQLKQLDEPPLFFAKRSCAWREWTRSRTAIQSNSLCQQDESQHPESAGRLEKGMIQVCNLHQAQVQYIPLIRHTLGIPQKHKSRERERKEIERKDTLTRYSWCGA